MTGNNAIIKAVCLASDRWKEAFNAGDAAACAACYEENAFMEAKPFGCFSNRKQIQLFWGKLIANGFSEVEYIAPNITAIDSTSAILSSDWKMNKAQGRITKELWVMQHSGIALLREDHFQTID